MITPELLARINELARKERAGGEQIFDAQKIFKQKVSSIVQDADEPVKLMSSLLERSD